MENIELYKLQNNEMCGREKERKGEQKGQKSNEPQQINRQNNINSGKTNGEYLWCLRSNTVAYILNTGKVGHFLII